MRETHPERRTRWEEMYPLGRRDSWHEHWYMRAYYHWGLKHHSVLTSEWYPGEPMWVTLNRPGFEKIGEILRTGA